MDSIQEFYAWEKTSRDTIDLKRCYVDIAGDLVSGLLLSQIIYWFLPGESGNKLRVEKEGKLWLAKGRIDWFEECRISPKQFDRAIQVLKAQGLVETKRFRFKGSPTIHIWLNPETLLQGVNWILTKGEKPTIPKVNNSISPKVKVEVDESVNSLTKTTAKTNPKNTPEKEKGLPSLSPVDVCFKAIHAYYKYPESGEPDPIPSYGKEGKAIKTMIGRGFDTNQILSCWIEKVQKRDSWVSMVWVNEDISPSSKGTEPEGRNAGVNKINSDDSDKYIKGKYGHMVRR